MGRYKNPELSVPCYKVFRHIFLSDEQQHLSKLGQEMQLSQSQIQDVRDSLIDKKFLETEQGKYGRKILNIPESTLADKWQELWRKETETDVEVDPEFLKKYVDAYFRFNDSGSIREMLVDDFFIGLKSYVRNQDASEYAQSLFEELSDEVDMAGPEEFIEFADRGGGEG